MTAVLTTKKEIFNLYLHQENLKPNQAKQISRLSDIDSTIYDKVVDLDPLSNVTDYVRERVRTVENTAVSV
jgi:hypothetical protein